MPQLDPTWIPSQFFWLIICFGTMLFLMSKLVIPKIAHVVDDRNKRIDDDLSAAEDLKAKADEVFEKYSQEISGAKKQANQILEETKSEMLEYSKTKSDEVEARLASMVIEGEAKIAKIKEDAMMQIKDIVCETASLSAKKLIEEDINSDEIKKVVEKVIEVKS